MKFKRTLLFLVLGIFFIIIVVGTICFMFLEKWSLVDSLYFTVMTVTTVGYGDLVPSHDFSKIVTLVFSLLSIPLIFLVFGIVVENYLEVRIMDLEGKLKEISKEEKEIEEIIEEKQKK